MIENLAWNSFKRTGNINTYLELSKYREIEKNLRTKTDETIKSEWDNNSRT